MQRTGPEARQRCGVLAGRVAGVAGASASLPSAIIGPITIGAPTAGNKVTGQVTFGGTATGPLYVGFYDQSSKAGVFVTQVGTKTNPSKSPASYTVYVPTGSNYFFFGIVDQNNNGVVDTGDIQNTGSDNSSSVSIAGAQSLNLTLPTANGNAAVTTNHSRQVNNGNTNDNYSLQFKVSQVIKRPVAVTLVSGPHVLVPMDAGLCGDCGRDPFNFWLSLGGLLSAPHRAEEWTAEGGERRLVHYYEAEGRTIWGVTGGIVHDLLELLGTG